MATTALAVIPQSSALEAVLGLVLGAVSNPETKRQYGHALAEFLAWQSERALPFNRASVQAWRTELVGRGLQPPTINKCLAAIRKLAAEAALNGYLDAETAAAVRQVSNARQSGNRAGNWLTLAEAQKLLRAPDLTTLKGKRDYAVLALLVGCALRRSEAAQLTFEHIQQREERWAIVDIRGKRGRIRTIAVPAWVKAAIDQWAEAAQLQTGPILRSIDQWGHIGGDSISGTAILDLTTHYGRTIGVALKAHDLRRTCAKLCRSAGSALEQIQLMLGHESIQTTERYLGTTQDLVNAPNDRLGLGRNQ